MAWCVGFSENFGWLLEFVCAQCPLFGYSGVDAKQFEAGV